ncbi:membrane protein [[Actinobacillus] muris]|uniref:Membrane protein n=1 Tax=Muribacter muris TaxID=67855 RepID=A0A0J5P6R2_9PAST|nr:DUF5389 family protein [Muribacter muris]KMK51159.1 membrane protein [[Actinobacillus] muris] [Muribacter muris]
MQSRFSPFSWALALFCLPSSLWPLALLVSPKFSEHPQLTATQIDLFSITFWVYPFVLLTVAGILYKVHKTHQNLARGLLILAFLGFYALCFHIISYI